MIGAFHVALRVSAGILLVAVAGCKGLQFGRAGVAPAIVTSQTPGIATGAGATLTGPANAAAPTTQKAERKTTYFRPIDSAPGVPESRSAGVAEKTPAPSSVLRPPSSVALVEERTETTIGQHQSASGIVKAAAELEGLSKPQWAGILCILGGLLALLWSAGHDQGYPLVYWKVIGCGIALLFVTNPWWLLLLLLPAGLYAAQKFGLLRFPLP